MRLAVILFACLLAATPFTAHATAINPLSDGYSLTVGSTVLSSTNASFDPTSGLLSFSDGTATYTFAEAGAAPLLSGLLVTRTCILVNQAECDSVTVAASDAKFLRGTLQASAAIGVTLQASASVGVTNLLFAKTSATAGSQSALVGYPDPSANSPVPEPATFGLVFSGLLGAFGMARLRNRA